MKYKKLRIVAVFALSILLVGGVAINYYLNNTTEEKVEALNKNIINEMEIHGLHVGYRTLDNLDKEAELIVVGSPIRDFKERNHVTTYINNTEVVNTFYTITELKVNKIIKSPEDFSLNKSKTIQIIEPIGLMETSEGLVKYYMNSYREMKKDSKYVIFLKKNTQGTYYGVINLNMGKFNIDNTDSDDNGKAVKDNKNKDYLELIEQQVQEKIEWKDKVKKKYENYLK